MRYALKEGEGWKEIQKAWHSKYRSQALFFVGGEMEGGRKFVGMQDLTFDVDLRQVWESPTNTLEILSNVKETPIMFHDARRSS